MGSARDTALLKLQQRIGYTFKDQDKLKAALTHSSTGSERNYERLEFLGDRVVNLIVAHELYDRFRNEPEGDLAKRHAALVQGKILTRVARTIYLGDCLRLSTAERTAGGADNDNILADTMEALLGALYLDADIEECRRVVLDLWGEDVNTTRRPPRDAKTALQEWAQARGLGLPAYRLASRSGPDHAPLFEIEVLIEGCPPTRSKGASRRKAEKEAAAMLLTHLEEMGE